MPLRCKYARKRPCRKKALSRPSRNHRSLSPRGSLPPIGLPCRRYSKVPLKKQIDHQTRRYFVLHLRDVSRWVRVHTNPHLLSSASIRLLSALGFSACTRSDHQTRSVPRWGCVYTNPHSLSSASTRLLSALSFSACDRQTRSFVPNSSLILTLSFVSGWLIFPPRIISLPRVPLQSMASVPDERQSGTLECSTEMDAFAESDSVSLYSSDDYVQAQIGGGRCEPSPVIVTPMRLRQKIKATGRDTGLVQEASFRRSQLPKPATPPSASKDTTIDDDPFLFSNCDEDRSSDLRHQVPESTSHHHVDKLFSDTTPSVTNGSPQGPGEETPRPHQPPVTKSIPSIKIVPPSSAPLFRADSPSPNRVPPCGTSLTSGGSLSVDDADIPGDKGDQASVVGRVPDSVLAILAEGFNEIDEMFSNLAARMKMPFHQVTPCSHISHNI